MIHSSSMGEFEHIKPLIKSIKETFSLNIVVTFFSPSGYENVKKFEGVDLFLYLPFDFIFQWSQVYRKLNAKMLIISKHDVWPNQIKAAKKYGVNSILVNASIGSKSSRTSLISRILLSNAYRNLDRMFVISAEDSSRFVKAFKCKNIDIAGDTKFDQVLIRQKEAMKKDLVDHSWLSKKLILVYGSLWPQDAQHVLVHINEILEKYKQLKIIIVPHQPTQEILNDFIKYLGQNSFTLYSDRHLIDSSRILIVDKIGMLADIYKYAHIAYVGGSFKQGIHNVMEPAIYGIPVLYGPKHTNSFEATQLLKAEGGISVNNAEEFFEKIKLLIESEEMRNNTGLRAKNFVYKNTGSTQKILTYIRDCLQES
ncbi:MAG: hypothetical protein H6627_03890 [Calditrichae bacterium]|nr:hypothetical protein [Calditrichota bacterium]MCB9057682.1 hypothetical protein [Calditrichia bacterium]